MNPRFRFGRWLVLLILGAVLVVASAFRILKAQQKPNSNFTGGVVTRLDEKPEGNIAHFRFEPGSRTKWHSHAGGQIILVEEGVGLYQNRGGPVMELRAGETVYCPPGVEHWHGAAPHQGGVQYNISRGGIVWLEEVTDKDYNTPPQHK